LADRPSKIGADPIFVAVVTKKKFLFCICGKSGFVLFRFDPYFIVTGTCPRFSEVLVYSVQLSGKSIEMIRINQRLLSSCRLLHVARDSGVGRLVMSSTACGKRQRSGETFTLCSSVIVKCGDKNENIYKNRLKLMILGMIYSTIYWRKVSLKSIKQIQYQ
jgi:hypothetical protein